MNRRPRIEPGHFRALERWVQLYLLDAVTEAGDRGVEASHIIDGDIVRRRPDVFTAGEDGMVRSVGWAGLDSDQRAKMCWRQIGRMSSAGEIEVFTGHNSRIRIKVANPLDRIVAAIEA